MRLEACKITPARLFAAGALAVLLFQPSGCARRPAEEGAWEGFHDIEWGTDESQILGTAAHSEPGSRFVEAENKEFEGLTLEGLAYKFADGKFCGVSMEALGEGNCQALLHALQKRYGTKRWVPDKYSTVTYRWNGVNSRGQEVTLTYYYHGAEWSPPFLAKAFLECGDRTDSNGQE